MINFTKRYVLIGSIGILVSSQLANLGVAMAIEEPSFTIETKNDEYEIRIYSSVLVAETKDEAGFGSESRYLEKLAKFKLLLERDSLSSLAEPVFAWFNAPFVPWFLRRNEIWIEVRN